MQNHPIQIRRYQESDWPAICSIHDAARPVEVSSFMPAEKVLAMADVAADDGFFDSECYVACFNHQFNHQIVGFVCMDPPELSWLYVLPANHRQGIGRQLVAYVLPKLGEDAYLTTALENEGGVKFYQQMGFRIAATFPGACQEYACTCVRLTLPGSRYENKPPSPVKAALHLAGYDDDNSGKAIRDPQGVWRWVR